MYLYLSLIPQALIASMLPPQEFGSYYAVGRHLHVQGEALFFELDPAFRSVDFPFDEAARKCVPGPAGEPKESVYLAVYRVLSRIPVNALGRLFAVTHDGRTLGLEHCAAAGRGSLGRKARFRDSDGVRHVCPLGDLSLAFLLLVVVVGERVGKGRLVDQQGRVRPAAVRQRGGLSRR